MPGWAKPLKSRHIGRLGAVLALLLAIVCVLFLDTAPTVERQGRPTAHDIDAARGAWRQLKAAQGTGSVTRLHFDNSTIDAIAALASDVSGRGSAQAEVTGGVLVARTSLSLPAGLWINASAAATGKHARFPDFKLKVGRVTFPLGAGRRFADLGRWAMNLKGADIPPLDAMVKQVTITSDGVVVDVVLPSRTGVVDGVIAASTAAVDEQLVSDIYCRIAAEQRARPVGDLSSLLKAAFSETPDVAAAQHNRATFIALSFLIVEEKAHPLAPRSAILAKDCPHPQRSIRLRGREDLAKHWVFSAALTSVLGTGAATSLGEWKELSDSLPGGSGFSFVDLAADRSGVKAALRGIDSSSAKATAKWLSRGSDRDLLPDSLLTGTESMSERSFEGSFGGLTEERYRQAVESIDRELARREDDGS